MPQYSSSIDLQLPQVPNGVPDELYSYFAEIYNAIGILRQAIDDNAVQVRNTWVPQLQFGGGNVGMTTSVASGVEVVCGNNLVWIDLRITLTNKGTSVGQAKIINLNTAGQGLDPLAVGAFLNLAAGVNNVVAEVLGGIIALFKAGAGTSVVMTDADFNNNSELIMCGFYRKI